MADNKTEISINDQGPDPDFKLEVPSVGIGQLRTSAGWVIMMLMAEDKDQRPAILLEIMKHLNIEIKDLIEQKHDKPCGKCGVSLLAHRDNKGACF